MIFVDTTYCLALAQPNDALHARAVAWTRVLTDQLLMTEYVLWQTINALSRQADRPRAALLVNAIRGCSDYELVSASPELFEASWMLHSQRTDKDWSLTDCGSFVVMQRRGIVQALT